jgi:hypothetical protein
VGQALFDGEGALFPSLTQALGFHYKALHWWGTLADRIGGCQGYGRAVERSTVSLSYWTFLRSHDG